MSTPINPDRLCLMCMKEKEHPSGPCPACGFSLEKYQAEKRKPHHLPLQTFLNGRYMTGAVLGEGGFGITYSAIDLVEGEHVAIKELFIKKAVSRVGSNTVILNNDPNKRMYFQTCRDQFVKEAEILRQLKDKSGIVEIKNSFFENGTAYLVMEYLEGVDLKEYLKQNGNRISFQDAFRFLRPVMKSLMEVQYQGIVHRDISPDNIRYLTNHTMKLFDFGSARSTIAADHVNMVVYKSGYTPPEQYSSNYEVGQWMDVYAMAATFYRCITGRLPKYSTDRTDDGDLESPRALGVDISEEVEAVLYKGMALKPYDRYADIGQFYHALKSAIGEPVSSGMLTSDAGKSDPAPSGKESHKYQELMQELNGSRTNKQFLYIIAVIAAIAMVIALAAGLIPT